MATDRRQFLKLGLGGFLFPLVGCGRPAALVEERIYVFGTMVDLAVGAADRSKAQRALATVAARFRQMHNEWHAWKPGALTELNAAIARGERVKTDPSIVELIRGGTELWRRSQGLFNPAIGGLVGLWGFHADEMPAGELPALEQIDSLRRRPPAMDDLVIDGLEVGCANPLVQLDFGGYAKGVALDWALDAIESAGCENAIVNLGGNLAAIGRRGERPWRIGVRHPQGDGVIAAVETQGREAVVTSGSYERYREWGGVRYPHIIDPRTGYPARHIASATVIDSDAGRADAAATALVVAGMKEWPAIARGMGVDNVMVIDDDGNAELSAAMMDRVRFVGTKPRSVSAARGA
jgi:thiamine biosynthesis lipoprotein